MSAAFLVRIRCRRTCRSSRTPSSPTCATAGTTFVAHLAVDDGRVDHVRQHAVRRLLRARPAGRGARARRRRRVGADRLGVRRRPAGRRPRAAAARPAPPGARRDARGRALHAPARVPRDPRARRGDRRGGAARGGRAGGRQQPVGDNPAAARAARAVLARDLLRLVRSLAAVPVGMLLWGPISDQIGVSTSLDRLRAPAREHPRAARGAAPRSASCRPSPTTAPKTQAFPRTQQGRQLAAPRALGPHGRHPALLEVDPPAGEVVHDLRERGLVADHEHARIRAVPQQQLERVVAGLDPSVSTSSSTGSMFSARHASRAVSSTRGFGLV